LRQIKRLSQLIITSFILLLFFLPLHTFAEEQTPYYNYLALGDSVAAGFLNDGTVNKKYGYPRYLAEFIEDETGYNVNLNNISVGGFQTENILAQLEDEAVLEEVRNADIITIDIGANDVLFRLYREHDVTSPGEVDLTDPEILDFTMKVAHEEIDKVVRNIDEILRILREEREDVLIYFMGYYNALRFMDAQEDVVNMIQYMNDGIEEITLKYNGIYVPTFDAFVDHYDEYLPTTDIHPSLEGSIRIAELFADAVIPTLGEPRDPIVEALHVVNNANDIDSLKEAIEIGALQLQLGKFDELESEDQEAVLEALLHARPEEGYESIGQLQETIDGILEAYIEEDSGKEPERPEEPDQPDKPIPPTDPSTPEEVWYHGEGVPNDDMGEIGNYYLDKATFNVYEKTEDGWVYAYNMKAPEKDLSAPTKKDKNDKEGAFGTLTDTSSDGAKEASGEALPKTGTNYPTMIALGIVLFIMGVLLQRRRLTN